MLHNVLDVESINATLGCICLSETVPDIYYEKADASDIGPRTEKQIDVRAAPCFPSHSHETFVALGAYEANKC